MGKAMGMVGVNIEDLSKICICNIDVIVCGVSCVS